MPRIRTVKPEFWADEKLAGMPRDARLLLIGLLNFADDDGRMRGSPMLIRAQVFPYDLDVNTESLLGILAEGSIIVRYEVGGESYIWIRNFKKHQRIDHPSESVLPPPPRPHSVKPRRTIAEGSTQEGKGKEEEGKGEEGNGTLPEPQAASGEKGRTIPTRKAYEAAFEQRWGTKPLSNRAANGQLAKFLDIVGIEAAPHVAEFYVSHPQALYVNAKHPLNLLLRDAQKLHTEWATAGPVTETEARLAERSAANVGSWAKHLKGGEA